MLLRTRRDTRLNPVTGLPAPLRPRNGRSISTNTSSGRCGPRASGFLLKDTPPADIIRAVRLVAAGEGTSSPTDGVVCWLPG
jgi:hypothetical protein